ncbi:hypothetical protein [Oleiagrimonas sp.]|jgi:hypothetical protein|uniref:DUF6988 family protein n=1 Tax=Oleiagrimonas sp. TaxID=2010330 RepID=UPI0026193985|nr:hypothetical protein [Oleiagrimonas sp.]MDA3913280.1 hypothetical protein [Oleiagrimonas sp.]
MDANKVMNSKEMAEIAIAANRISRDIRVAIDKFAPEKLTARQRLARGLLTSSIEQSIALTDLLAKDDPYIAYPALTLFRPQLEALARGVFFSTSDISTDEEVKQFIYTDKMPKRPPPDGGTQRRQYLSELLDSTRGVLKLFLPPDLVTRVDEIYTYNLDLYNAFVHGGYTVQLGYENIQSNYIFSPHFYRLMNIARHSLAQAHFAEGVLSAIVYRLDHLTNVAPNRVGLVEEYATLVKGAARTYRD